MLKVLVGAIVGGIVVFMWGFISHEATPIGAMGLLQIPDEEKVGVAMKESIHKPGVYFFPGRDMSQPMSKSELETYAAKTRQGPSGLLIIHPEGNELISPARLLIELGSSIVAAFIAAVVLTQVRSGYFVRVLVVTSMGLFAFLSVLVSYWNWYGFSTEFTTGAALDEIIGWFLAGLVLAAIVRPAKVAKVDVPG